ncbi:hypothetical protein DPMN_150857 [Dreissena polymorpha]|uniref:Uncharacterized protein n=1 Tax=Dreissena polymorpha TaxID=45954 RepID=A0A9D3YLM2_DREPO|nr:hypothetical protein DPMN_076032 [Dreissena polymorpha]KAH3797279.1 hypothetical protein DPMN_150857 [Dreissena polymorpha]
MPTSLQSSHHTLMVQTLHSPVTLVMDFKVVGYIFAGEAVGKDPSHAMNSFVRQGKILEMV